MEFDPRAYPRTYHLTDRSRWIRILFGAAVIALGLANMAMPGQGPALGLGPRNMAADWLFLALAVGLGVMWIARAIRAKIILTADAVIVVGTLIPRQFLRREEISGTRSYHVSVEKVAKPGSITLVPNRPGLDPLTIENDFERDEAFRAWMSGFVDLDPLTDEVARARRLALLQSAHGAVATLSIAAVIPFYLLIFGAMNQDPRIMFPIILLPWLAILFLWQQRDAFALSRNNVDGKADISPVLYLPGVLLAVGALWGVHLLDWRQLLFAAAIVWGGLAGAAMLVVPELRENARSALTILLLTLPYGYGAAAVADTAQDPVVRQKYRTVVQARHEHASQWMGLYVIRMAPWGPGTESVPISVDPRLYSSVREGDTVCVTLWPGTIGVPWYTVSRCR